MALAVGLASASQSAAGPQQAGRPNVVVVMTDDQTVEQMGAMPRTRELIGAAGATFANSFASFPLCCPSRATFLTGQYAHNHQVLNNAPPQGGFQKLRTDETLAVWLQRAGYTTAQIGKFMNGYETSPVGVPPGWSEWHGEKSINRYYGYQLLEDGELVTYGDPDEDPVNPAQPETYSTDVYTAKAVDFIEREAPGADPFFLWLSYNAPHAGQPNGNALDECRGRAKPAVRHRGAFSGAELPRPPSFNEADVSDKPPSVRERPSMTPADVAAVERNYRCEREALLAVDEGVEAVVRALAAQGELRDTYVLFTSDNGYHHGEHRIPFEKHTPYEESLRVPLLARGPGIPRGVTVSELVSNVDLASTILEATGARARLPQDGRSLLRIARRPARQRGRDILIDTNRYRGIRNARFTYVEHTAKSDRPARELYDLEADPFQLESLHRDREYRQERRALEKRLRDLRRCSGEECAEAPRVKAKRVRCTASAAVLAVVGKDVNQLAAARFGFGGKVRADSRAPWRARVPLRRLDPGGPRVDVELELIDGRLISRSKDVRC